MLTHHTAILCMKSSPSLEGEVMGNKPKERWWKLGNNSPCPLLLNIYLFVYLCLTKIVCIYGIQWCFGKCIKCEMITTIKLINICSTSCSYFFCVW